MDTVSEAWTYGHSLNRERRRRELQRITEANLGILKRIQAVQPVYSADKWEEERLAQEALVEAICEYKDTPLLAPPLFGGGVRRAGSAEGGIRGRSISPEPGAGAGAGGPAFPGGYSGGAGAPLYSGRGGIGSAGGSGALAGGGRAVMGLAMPGPPPAVGAAAGGSSASFGGGGGGYVPHSARSGGPGAGGGGGAMA